MFHLAYPSVAGEGGGEPSTWLSGLFSYGEASGRERTASSSASQTIQTLIPVESPERKWS
jgi:hypothetical protein